MPVFPKPTGARFDDISLMKPKLRIYPLPSACSSCFIEQASLGETNGVVSQSWTSAAAAAPLVGPIGRTVIDSSR